MCMVGLGLGGVVAGDKFRIDDIGERRSRDGDGSAVEYASALGQRMHTIALGTNDDDGFCKATFERRLFPIGHCHIADMCLRNAGAARDKRRQLGMSSLA